MENEDHHEQVLLLAILALTACSTAPRNTAKPVTAPGGIITDLHTGETLSPSELISKLAAQPRVIVGEKHDNPSHHQIENWLVQSLPAVRPQGSVLMEMLTPDQQPKVDQVKAWLQTDPDARLAKKLGLVDVRRCVMTAMKAPYPLLSANLDRSEIIAFYENPQFPAGAIRRILRYETPSATPSVPLISKISAQNSCTPCWRSSSSATVVWRSVFWARPPRLC